MDELTLVLFLIFVVIIPLPSLGLKEFPCTVILLAAAVIFALIVKVPIINSGS
jgi:hypothetical protein